MHHCNKKAWEGGKGLFKVFIAIIILPCMLAYHTWEEAEGLQVLQDVAILGGDQHHIELLQRLVDIAHTLRLHKRVLLACVHQLGEGGQQALYTRPCHLHKLPWHQSFSSLGAHCCSQQHLQTQIRIITVSDLIMYTSKLLLVSHNLEISKTKENCTFVEYPERSVFIPWSICTFGKFCHSWLNSPKWRHTSTPSSNRREAYCFQDAC